MNYPLSEAEEPIRWALERLVAKDVGTAWVVVDKVGNPDVFVQFARLVKTGALVFDVPLLRIVLEETTPEAGAARAVETLSGSFGIASDERVVVHEEEDGPPPWKGAPFWKRLFA